MQNVYCYTFVVGTADFSRIGLDDRKARRLLARWLRLVWPKLKAAWPGSVAAAINAGQLGAVKVQIGRIRMEGKYTVPAVPYTMIENFELSPESIAEICQVWDRPRRS